MYTLIFTKQGTELVTFAIADVALIRYVTSSHVGFVDKNGRHRSAPFSQDEDLTLERMFKQRKYDPERDLMSSGRPITAVKI